MLFRSMRLLRDDAGVVYLNGTEIFRSSNLPQFPTAITYTTLARTTGENTIDDATLDATSLRAGENIVAVEIHQEATTSSDISFDLELVGVRQQIIQLGLAAFGNENVLYWDDATSHLEMTTDLSAGNGWTRVSATIPYTIPNDGTSRFFRLSR